MAFENGNNIFSYAGEIFLKYKNDNLAFMKALQTVQYFETRPDYPYCMDELDNAIERLLGQSLTAISYGARKYAVMGEMSEEDLVNWDPTAVDVYCEGEVQELINMVKEMSEEEASRLTTSFKNEFLSFCYALSPVFDKIFLMDDSPMKIAKLSISESFNSREKMLRFIRNDGYVLDIEASRNDLEFIIRTLEDNLNDGSD